MYMYFNITNFSTGHDHDHDHICKMDTMIQDLRLEFTIFEIQLYEIFD